MMNSSPVRRVKPIIDVTYQGMAAVANSAQNSAAFIFKGIEEGQNGHTGMIAFVCQANVFHGDQGIVRLYFPRKHAQAVKTGVGGACNAMSSKGNVAISVQRPGSEVKHEVFVSAEDKAQIASFHICVPPRRRTGDVRREARMQRRHREPANTCG